MTHDDDFSDTYTFSWKEIKEEGKKYIYMICPEPFSGFYSFWGYKIKIKNLGGKLSAGTIVGIIIGCLVFICFKYCFMLSFL